MTQDATRPTVLIVDDAAANIAVVAGALKNSFNTRIAMNGERALAIANGGEPIDLILLDVSLPGVDGIEVCRRLKSNPTTADIPVIFLTARTEAENEELGFAVGGVDYTHKRFSSAIVVARVNTQIALRAALRQAREAHERADRLLHALLPDAVANEINTIGSVIPRRHDEVAVLFCDVVDFTSYCERNKPEDVISRLDALFVLLERVARSHGLEKVKTVGDALMAAAGLLNEEPDALRTAVYCGLEMAATTAASGLGWGVRIGVAVGPVVAGVVGQDRYQFDIWGDTVNLAARLTEKPMPGCLAVSEDNWLRIAGHFRAEPLGNLDVKGKGLMSVYQIQAANPH